MEKICVIGLGYIGLPTASLLATKGFQVTGVDVNPKVVETINKGQIHIHEPDLDVLVKAAVQSGNLKAAQEPAPSDVFIMAVPTPFKENHKPDMKYVEAATRLMAPCLKEGDLVILESTSPVGTTEQIGRWVRELRPDLREISLAHCPERVLPGHILKELVNNDRVIGGVDERSSEKARLFYEKFVNGQIFVTDSRTAELTKLSENAFRDVNIAFANELSLVCDQLGVDVWRLIELANRHPRVNILQPGPGVGGHCIAVDPWFIVDSAPEQARLMRMAREVNDSKPRHVARLIQEKCKNARQQKIACLGLAFKANVDDLRESPAIDVVKELADMGYHILAVEPHVDRLPQDLAARANIELVPLEKALVETSVVALLVDHKAFLAIDRTLLKNKTLVDTRGAWREAVR